VFKNLKLGAKLLLAFLAVGVTPFVVIGLTSLFKSSGALTDQAFAQLTGIREIKKAQIERFFAEREGDVGVLVDTVQSLEQEAKNRLEAVQQIKRAEVAAYFGERFDDVAVLSQNEHVRQALAVFGNAFASDGGKVGGGAWLAAEEKYGTWLREYKETYGYYDLFLIHRDGDVLYTVSKESDLGQNIAKGGLRNSPLAKCFQKALDGPAIQDFEPYAPSNNQFAAFIGAPVKGANGETVGVVAMQLPTGPVNTMVQRREGMGASGETYLVGSQDDKSSFRSDMKTMGDGKYIIGHEISSPYIKKALAGQSGYELVTDSAGALVMVVYDPLQIEGLQWAIISKINLEEAIASRIEGEKEDYFTKYIRKYGYYDLFLIHREGMVFYTVGHEADYGTNIMNGQYADSGLGKLVRKVAQTKQFGIADFAPYAPSNGAPAAFIAQPVLEDGQIKLIVALQLSLDAVNAIMQERSGMGKTGETYLVGPDKLMRSDSFLDPQNHTVLASFANPAKGSVDTEASRQALAGGTDTKIVIDYNGNPVLSSFTPVKVGDFAWALLAEIDEAEALAAVNTLKWLMGIVFILGVVAIVFTALVITRSITGPLAKAVTMLNELGCGHLGMRLKMDRADEIGQMAKTMDQFADDLQNIVVAALEKLAAGDLTFEAVPKDEKDVIGVALKKSCDDLNRTVASIQEAADSIASISEQVSSSAQELSQGTSEQSSNVEEVSSSMEEMNSSVSQNAENARQTEAIAAKSAADAQEGGAAVNEMAAAMAAVSEKITIIEEIARQTNLLALNAAIEAARAGEHGKGFAVVAVEVRKLAERSQASAQEIISLSNNSMQITERASRLIGDIVPGIKKTADLVQEIAAASEEQARGVSQVTKAIEQVDQVIQQNSAATEEMAASGEEMASQAQMLREQIAIFKIKGQRPAVRVSRKVQKRGALKPPQGQHPPRPAVPDPGLALDLDDEDFERVG